MEAVGRNELMEKRKPSVLGRILAVLLITVLLIAAAAYGGLYVVMNGPSPHAESRLMETLGDNPAGIAVLRLFMSAEMIDEWQQTAQDGEAETLYSVYPQPE